MATDNGEDISRSRLTLIVLALVLLGLGVRWLAACCICEDVKGDYAVDAIMTQHIATGRILPTFFYGQPYMGVPEIYLSSFFFWLFGKSLVVIFTGKIIVSILVLLAMFGWVREVGGWRAGIAAMLFCLIGPLHIFAFYYGATLLQVILLLWWGTRLSLGPPRTLAALGLGLLAGFGWYTNQLLFGTLLAVALLLVCTWRWKLWWRPGLAGLVGFMLGGGPWWIWNLRHHWQSLDFRGSFRGLSVFEGLQYLALRLAELFDLTEISPGLLAASVLLYAMLFAAAAYYIFAHYRTRPVLRRCLWVLLLLIVFNAYCFAISHFARLPAPRYAMPLLPVYVLLIGLGSAYLTRDAPRWGWLPVLALVGIQALNSIPGARLSAQENHVFRKTLPTIVDFFQQQKCDAIFAPWSFGWLNFAVQERLPIGEVTGERCADYERAVEKATRLGLMGDYADQIIKFAQNSGGQAAQTNIGGVLLAYDLQAPVQQRRLLDPGEIVEISHQTDRQVAASVLDRDLATEWAVPLEAKQTKALEIRFREPTAACSIRLNSAIGRYPALWRVERERADGTWEAATPSMLNEMWFWSGPRIFWHGSAYRLETSFAPIPTRKLRLHFGTMRNYDELHVSELFVYATTAQAPRLETAALPELLALLNERKARYAYADRWLANQIHQRSAGAIATSREPAVIHRDADEPAYGRQAMPEPCSLRADTAVIVHQVDAPLTRATLASLQIPMRETVLAPWIVFDFAPNTWRPEFGCYDNLFWTGWTCLQNSFFNKQAATHLMALARPSAAQLALRLWPTHQMALRALGRPTPQPAAPLPIRYDNGATLTGLTFNNTTLTPGQKLAITTFWQFDRNEVADRPTIFFHFVNAAGEITFQDDFGLLNHIPADALQFPYAGEIVPIQREIVIPANAAPGRYIVHCGALSGYTQRRLQPHTTLPVKKGQITLPIEITVAAVQAARQP